MTFSVTEMMELGITQPINIHNTRSLIRTLKYVLHILQTEEASTVEEYKHTHTHTHSTAASRTLKLSRTLLGIFCGIHLISLQTQTESVPWEVMPDVFKCSAQEIRCHLIFRT